ncbi:hypothetical protein R3P38DRAFT_3354264 [Favolaschia claudopus]|uniref:Uncharacterized protein n=1 Tax=Favolaschia claudopus TaxID=2862362 RepID=A0AAW0BP01_9AGAR
MHVFKLSVQNIGLFQGNYKTKFRGCVQTDPGTVGGTVRSYLLSSSAHAVKRVAETLGASGVVTELEMRSRRNKQDGADGAGVGRRIMGVRDAGTGGERGGGSRQYKSFAMAASVELSEKIRHRHFDAACVRVGKIDVTGMRSGRGFGQRRRHRRQRRNEGSGGGTKGRSTRVGDGCRRDGVMWRRRCDLSERRRECGGDAYPLKDVVSENQDVGGDPLVLFMRPVPASASGGGEWEGASAGGVVGVGDSLEDVEDGMVGTHGKEGERERVEVVVTPSAGRKRVGVDIPVDLVPTSPPLYIISSHCRLLCYIRAGKKEEGRGREETKAGLGRAGARPDEGGHVIGPDEGPGESEEPGEMGKARQSRAGPSEAKEAWPRAWEQAGRKVGQGYKEPDEFGRGYERCPNTQDQEMLSKEKSGREGDEREEIRTVRQGDNVNYQTKEYNRETVGI